MAQEHPASSSSVPTAGGTCALPDGPSHPCAADCDHSDCHVGWFARNPRGDGLLYCCTLHGWLTPADAFDASWDAYSGWADDL